MTGKTIVYLPNWLGDMVMAIPFLASLKASLDSEIWAVGKTNAIHIYNGLALFDRFIAVDSKAVLPFLETVTAIKNHGFQRGIVLPHSFRSALLFYLAGMDQRIGYARNKRGFMLTHRVQEDNIFKPTVEHYLKIIDSLGAGRLTETPALSILTDEEQRFDEAYLDVNKPYIVFVTGAQYGPSKCWPSGHFSELANMITGELGMKIYILPGKGEEGLAREVYNGASRKELIEIKSMDVRDLKVCLSRASVVVSNDTGPRHISAALSVPTVVLLGPMDERYTSYPSDFTYTVSKDVPCKPCNNKKCDRDHECLKGITPKEVFAKVKEILHKSGR